MKHYLLFLAPGIILLACNNSNPEHKEPEPDPVPVTEPAPAPEVKDHDGTTIKVDENGVSYESKKGDSKNEVKISNDSSRIEIKTK